MAFDPTPDEAKVPQQKDDKQAATQPKNRLQPPPPPPDSKKAETQSVKDADQDDQQEEDKKDDDLPPPAPATHWGRWVLIGAVPAGADAALALILGLKLNRRRRRRMAHRRPGLPVAGPRFSTPRPISASRRYRGRPGRRPRQRSTPRSAAPPRCWPGQPIPGCGPRTSSIPADADRFWTEVDAAVLGMGSSRGPCGGYEPGCPSPRCGAGIDVDVGGQHRAGGPASNGSAVRVDLR